MRYKVTKVGAAIVIRLPQSKHFDAGGKPLDKAGDLIEVTVVERYTGAYRGRDATQREYVFTEDWIVR